MSCDSGTPWTFLLPLLITNESKGTGESQTVEYKQTLHTNFCLYILMKNLLCSSKETKELSI